MPELPEITAHAERLEEAFAGATLERFESLSFTALKTHTPDPNRAGGQRLIRIGHRGKYLLMGFEEITFVVHLMQGGRIKVDATHSRRPRGGLARWTFEDGRALLLTEAGSEKRAGTWLVSGDPEDQEPIRDLGPDADQIELAELTRRLHDHSKRLHGFLRDQTIIAGLGRRLANEIPHRARLSPLVNTNQLDADRASHLWAAIRDGLADSLAHERARADMSTSSQRPSRVHHRVGEPCPACGDTVRAVEYHAYTIAYCPTCQTNGRALANNTTSRFLK